MSSSRPTRSPLVSCCSLTIGLILAACGDEDQPAEVEPPAPQVETALGTIQGVEGEGHRAFLGIPYAAPPVGELRWRPPQAPEPWDGVLEATEFGPSCPQVGQFAELLGVSEVQDEDCLTLNIWTPAPVGSQPIPVMVYLHGGALVEDSSSNPLYNGARLASQGVVVVTLNYRLNVLGFLAHPALSAEDPEWPVSGNYGLLDQQRALAWVGEHIAAFGGDPDNVTLFGQSAGARSTCLQIAMPEGRALFQRAIMESPGRCIRPAALEVGESVGVRLAETAGCVDPEGAAACLRAQSTDRLLAAYNDLGQDLSPVVDGLSLPRSLTDLVLNGQLPEVTVIMGTTAEEGVWRASFWDPDGSRTAADYEAFVEAQWGELAEVILEQYPVEDFDSPRDALASVITDGNYVCRMRFLTKLTSALGWTVYRYLFSHPASAPFIDEPAAFHGADLPLVFGNAFFDPLTAEEEAFVDTVMGYWVRFAATGDPNGQGAVGWPVYDVRDDPQLDLALEPRVERGTLTELCDFWEDLYFEAI